MGYTHHWHEHDIPTETWALICADANKLTEATPVALAEDDDGSGLPPVINHLRNGEIRFNGSNGLGYETFRLLQNSGRDYCKTGERPYDAVVCAVLAVAKEHHPALFVSSDGSHLDWQPHLDWASEVLGRRVPLPIPGPKPG